MAVRSRHAIPSWSLGSLQELGCAGEGAVTLNSNGVTIHTNGIAIIEFLGPEEYKSGASIFESFVRPTWQDCPNQFHFYAPTKEKLFEALGVVALAVREQGFKPLVHIESLGSEHGLAPTRTGTPGVTWREIKPIFQEINRFSEFNTVLMVSACNGAHFVSALDPTDAAPFWGILGPIGIARAEDLLEDFGGFYRSFLVDYDFMKAFAVLNSHREDEARNYHFYTADHFFMLLWATYIKTEGSKVALDRRVTKLMSRAPSITGAGKRAYGRMRQKLLAQLGDHEGYFERLKGTYFMEDVLPGMADRFGVTYERVLDRLS
jgi:hypothetical protein